MMSSHRLCGRFNQSAGQLLTNLMTTVVNQAGQLFHRHAAESGRSGRDAQLAQGGSDVRASMLPAAPTRSPV